MIRDVPSLIFSRYWNYTSDFTCFVVWFEMLQRVYIFYMSYKLLWSKLCHTIPYLSVMPKFSTSNLYNIVNFVIANLPFTIQQLWREKTPPNIIKINSFLSCLLSSYLLTLFYLIFFAGFFLKLAWPPLYSNPGSAPAYVRIPYQVVNWFAMRDARFFWSGFDTKPTTLHLNRKHAEKAVSAMHVHAASTSRAFLSLVWSVDAAR